MADEPDDDLEFAIWGEAPPLADADPPLMDGEEQFRLLMQFARTIPSAIPREVLLRAMIDAALAETP